MISAEQGEGGSGTVEYNGNTTYTKYKGKTFDLWLYGVSLVIGGQLYGWNEALTAGFGSWIVAQSLMGVAYTILVFSLAEIQSAIPCTGGSYSMAQIVLGFYLGFQCGCFELVEYVFNSVCSIMFISHTLVSIFDLRSEYQFLVMAVYFLIALSTCIPEGRVLFYTGNFLGVFCLLLILVYVIGSLPHINLAQNGPLFHETDDSTGETTAITGNHWFVGGFDNWFPILPSTTWAFCGIEALVLMTSIAEEPKKTIPRAMAASVLTLFSSIIVLSFIAASLPPGMDTMVTDQFYMWQGFQLISSKIPKYAVVLLIMPGQYGMTWCFTFCYSKILRTMAQSNLMPGIFKLKDTTSNLRATLISTSIVALLCVICYFEPAFDVAIQNIFILCAIFTYLCQIVMFIKMRTEFLAINRNFHSPFGIIGAVISGIFFSLAFISTAFFQDDNYVAFISALSLFVILTIYYFLDVRGRQVFSAEEQEAVFRLHVIKFNNRKFQFNRGSKSRPNQLSRGSSLNRSNSTLGYTVKKASIVPLNKDDEGDKIVEDEENAIHQDESKS